MLDYKFIGWWYEAPKVHVPDRGLSLVFQRHKILYGSFTSHRIGSLNFAVGNGGELELILIFMSSQTIHFESLDFVANNFSPPAAT